MDASGHPELLVMTNVSAVDLAGDCHVFLPSLIGVCEMGQVEGTEHGLNALTQLTVYEGKSISNDLLGHWQEKILANLSLIFCEQGQRTKL